MIAQVLEKDPHLNAVEVAYSEVRHQFCQHIHGLSF